MAPLLTIDGPSGSGKGTIARQVAERLGWHLLDSGALYRLVALAAQGAYSMRHFGAGPDEYRSVEIGSLVTAGE